MKKLLKGLLVCALALTVTACGGGSSNDDVVTYTAGVSPDYAPYESLDTNGNIVGFDVDMAEKLAEYMSEEEGKTVKIEFKQMEFDGIVTQIQGNQIDLGISGFTYKEDRKVEWSDPYLGTAQVAVLPKDSKITSLSELEGKALAAQSGATGEEAAKAVKNATVKTFKNAQEIFNGLAAKQYDAAIVDSGVAKEYVSSGNFIMLEESLLDEKNYVIAKEGNTELIEKVNKAIAKFIASDDYKTLCEQYELVALEQ